MKEIRAFLTSKEIKNLINSIENIFKNFPHLPKKVTKIIVDLTPFFVIFGAFVMILSGAQNLFGFDRFHRLFTLWNSVPKTYFYFTGILEIASGLIFLLAYKPLRDRKIEGWILLFWTTGLELLRDMVEIFLAFGGLLGSLISVTIGLYLLFEIKDYYKAKKVIKKKK